MQKSRVAIFLIVGNVDGGGGIERLYLNFLLMSKGASAGNIDIITTAESKANILSLYPRFPKERIRAFPVWHNRFSKHIMKAYLRYFIALHRYTLIHIANFDSYYDFLYRFIATKTKLTLNIIDCRFEPEFAHERYDTIKAFIGSSALSGILSWYKNAAQPVAKLNPRLHFKAVSTCFTDYGEFAPAPVKKQEVVFAARLSSFKRPDDYLKAVALCLQKDPGKFASWSFLLWGDGDMQQQIDQTIAKLGLKGRVKTGFCKDMSGIFNSSSIFVSTQMYENFTSLSMLEAMASGNAIVSYNVGQTDFFVKDGFNGLLAREETPDALADALLKLMQSPLELAAYQAKSARFAREVHNVNNFSREVIEFWNKAMASG